MLPSGSWRYAEAHDFNDDGIVFDQDGVKVFAFEVNHGPLIKPAYGYRVDYAGRSVAISGEILSSTTTSSSMGPGPIF
jgi:ribonuclease Z